MRDRLRKVKGSLLLIGLWLLVGSNLYAACCPPSNYYVAVDALYWKPMHCPIFAAARDSFQIIDDFDELYLTGEYNPGVRARLGYQGCHWFTDIAYLYFCSTENREEGIDGFQSMQIPIAFSSVTSADTSATFQYQNVEERLGRCFCFNPDFTIFLYGNIRWIKIHFKSCVQGPSSEDPSFLDFFKQNAQFNGGGFGFGVGGRYGLCWGFGLHGNTGIMAIIGETKLNNYSSNIIDFDGNIRPNFLDRPERWNHILPALTFALGLDYLFCWCSYTIQAEIGYELEYYKNVLRYASDNFIQLIGLNSEIPLFNCQDIGFSGPYFNLSVKF